MKLIRFEKNGVRCGILEGGRIFEIAGTLFDPPERTGAAYAPEDVKALAPVVPGKALCIGLNYRDHIEETNSKIPSAPVVFMKPGTAVIAPSEPIERPSWLKRVDLEAELAIVIGRIAKNISEEDAPGHILGYTCANDVSGRDIQPSDGQWTLAKGFDTFLPIGPYIETEIDPNALNISAKINGRTVQSSNTRHLIFKPAMLVSHISRVMTLLPGDVILTGTPSGVSPLAGGDVARIEIDGLGALENPVVSVDGEGIAPAAAKRFL